MEKSVVFDFDQYIRESFGIEVGDIQQYSPLTLAYIGDCVYDLIIKSMVIGGVNRQVQKLHKDTSSLVNAAAQSEVMRTIQPLLTPEELAVYKRGRNSKTITPAKNQSVTDYRRATGFEALIGYLYLNKEFSRLIDIVKIGLDSSDTYREMCGE